MTYANIKEEIVGLLGAYGFTVEFERPEEGKTRFRGNGTFLDLWIGKRGITAGVYNKKTSSMGFQRNLNVNRIEELVIPIHKAYTD